MKKAGLRLVAPPDNDDQDFNRLVQGLLTVELDGVAEGDLVNERASCRDGLYKLFSHDGDDRLGDLDSEIQALPQEVSRPAVYHALAFGIGLLLTHKQNAARWSQARDNAYHGVEVALSWLKGTLRERNLADEMRQLEEAFAQLASPALMKSPDRTEWENKIDELFRLQELAIDQERQDLLDELQELEEELLRRHVRAFSLRRGYKPATRRGRTRTTWRIVVDAALRRLGVPHSTIESLLERSGLTAKYRG